VERGPQDERMTERRNSGTTGRWDGETRGRGDEGTTGRRDDGAGAMEGVGGGAFCSGPFAYELQGTVCRQRYAQSDLTGTMDSGALR